MQQPSHPFGPARVYDFLNPPGEGGVSELAMRWHSLDEAGRVVAAMAGATEPRADRKFVDRVEALAGERRRAAEQGIDDLAAMMEPGLAALLYICENGGDAHAPAVSLWREYSDARAALLALAIPQDA